MKMQNPSHAELEELFREIIVPFYHIRRNNCVPFADDYVENDAEHSWSLAFFACALAPKIDPNLDVGLIAQFAIVHDIVEVYAGDTSNLASDEEKATKADREAAALKKITARFTHFPWIIETLERYEMRECGEAKFVYALDKYMPVMLEYLGDGGLIPQRKLTLQQFRGLLARQREKAHTHAVVGKYYDEIRDLLESHDEYFALPEKEG